MTLPPLFDLAAGLLVALLVLYGLLRGLARLALRVAGLVIGWYLALRWCEPVGVWLGARSPGGAVAREGPDLARMAAFGAVFAAVVAASALTGWLITRALGKVKLGGLNRLAGAGVGLLAAIVLACAATVPLVGLWPPDGGAALRGSTLAPFAVAGGGYLTSLAPEGWRARFELGARAVLDGPTEPTPEPDRRPR